VDYDPTQLDFSFALWTLPLIRDLIRREFQVRLSEVPPGRLRLFLLPPYSPELNPDEWEWNHLKHHASPGSCAPPWRNGKAM